MAEQLLFYFDGDEEGHRVVGMVSSVWDLLSLKFPMRPRSVTV